MGGWVGGCACALARLAGNVSTSTLKPRALFAGNCATVRAETAKAALFRTTSTTGVQAARPPFAFLALCLAAPLPQAVDKAVDQAVASCVGSHVEAHVERHVAEAVPGAVRQAVAGVMREVRAIGGVGA